MTATEFARKYNIDQTTAHMATFKTPTRIASRTPNVPEEELKQAVIDTLKQRIEFYRKKIQLNEERLKSLTGE